MGSFVAFALTQFYHYFTFPKQSVLNKVNWVICTKSNIIDDFPSGLLHFLFVLNFLFPKVYFCHSLVKSHLVCKSFSYVYLSCFISPSIFSDSSAGNKILVDIYFSSRLLTIYFTMLPLLLLLKSLWLAYDLFVDF